jgi:hypothetical protein
MIPEKDPMDEYVQELKSINPQETSAIIAALVTNSFPHKNGKIYFFPPYCDKWPKEDRASFIDQYVLGVGDPSAVGFRVLYPEARLVQISRLEDIS